MPRHHGDMSIEELLAKKRKRKAAKDGSFCWITIVSNYLHQSFFYLDRTERAMRVFWEVVPVGFLCWLLTRVLAPVNAWLLLGVSVGCVHTLNWIFNNNFWNCLNCAFPSFRNRGTQNTLNYLNRARARLSKARSITGIMFLGSLSRFEWHDRSDIDMRILRRPGFWNGIVASLLTSRERVLAVFARQPLDLYLADTPEFLKHHRVDERPIFTLRRDERLSEADFPGGEVQNLKFETFNIKS